MYLLCSSTYRIESSGWSSFFFVLFPRSKVNPANVERSKGRKANFLFFIFLFFYSAFLFLIYFSFLLLSQIDHGFPSQLWAETHRTPKNESRMPWAILIFLFIPTSILDEHKSNPTPLFLLLVKSLEQAVGGRVKGSNGDSW